MRTLRWCLVPAALLALASCGSGDDPGGDGEDGPGLRFEGEEQALGRSGTYPDLAATADGNLHLCYRGDPARGDDGVYYQFFRASSGTWTASVQLDDDAHRIARGLEFGSPSVASAPSGGALVVWAGFPDPGNSVWAREIAADGSVGAGFQLVHSERSIAVEQHDVAVDAAGTAHVVFGLVGAGQDGVYHKSRPAGGAWDGGRRRVFHQGRKHPTVEARRGAGGSGPLLWAAWRFRDLEYSSFDGAAWSQAVSIAAPQGLSIGDPALAVRADEQPNIATSPHQSGATNRSTYVHEAGSSEPLRQIDIVTPSSTGVVDVAMSASGPGVLVWDRFVLGVRPDRTVITEIRSLDTTRDTIVNKRRICYKLSDGSGRFPSVPDEDNSNAFVVPWSGDFAAEQSYPTVEIHGTTVDLVYQDARAFPRLELYHRRARLP